VPFDKTWDLNAVPINKSNGRFMQIGISLLLLHASTL